MQRPAARPDHHSPVQKRSDHMKFELDASDHVTACPSAPNSSSAIVREKAITRCSRALLIALFMVSTYLVAAQVSEQLYRFPQTVPPAYRVDARSDYDRMANEPYKEFRKRDVERFAEMTAYGKKNIMGSGRVYYDPPLAEAYLGRVLAAVVPGSKARVFMARDAELNAFAVHDGSLFMNVGILAEMPNEAALAGVMGHEVSHFLNDDNRAGFFNKLKLYDRRNRNSNYEMRIDKAHEDRQMEHVADSMGAWMARKAGYDLQWTISTFMLFLDPHMEQKIDTADVEKTSAVSEQNARTALLSDHPDARDRIDFIAGWLASDSNLRGGSTEVVDGAMFRNVRHMARIEALQVLMEGHHYYACIERAFRYHLSDPQEKSFLYFLAEGLRRYLYIMPDMGLDGFLVDGYEKYFPKGEGVLHNLSFLLRDSSLISTVDTSGYYLGGKPAFNTNNEALVYFLEKGDRAGVVDVLLSKAIHFRKDITVRDDCLKRYVDNGGTAKNFVDAFLNNQLERKLRKNKGALLLLDEIDFVEDHTYGYRTRYVLGEERSPKFSGVIRSMVAKHFPTRTVIGTEDLKREDLGSFLAYSRVARNINIVQWMWDYEQARAVKREQLRGKGLLRKRRKVKVEQHNTEGDMGTDSLGTATATPEEEGVDPAKWKRRKRTKQDMKFYFIDPLYWEFLIDKGFATVEYMKISAFDDKTRITGNTLGSLFFLYPGYWDSRVSNGSNRYSFQLKHVKFNSGTQQVRVRNTTVGYKMDRPNLRSVVYDSMRNIDP